MMQERGRRGVWGGKGVACEVLGAQGQSADPSFGDCPVAVQRPCLQTSIEQQIGENDWILAIPLIAGIFLRQQSPQKSLHEA